MLDQTRHIYLSSSNQVLEERVDAGTAASIQNIWGLMYIDGLVLRDRDTDGNGTLDERRSCLQDGNWNAVALVDTSGDVTQRFCYQPFGTCEFLTAGYDSGSNTSDWTALFTGRELDRESGLYYFRARYWHPALGRFMGRDPLQYIDGGNLHSGHFVPNSTDPIGLSPWGHHLLPRSLTRHCRQEIKDEANKPENRLDNKGYGVHNTKNATTFPHLITPPLYEIWLTLSSPIKIFAAWT